MLEGVVQDGKGVKRLASDSPPASSKSVKLPRPVDEEQRSAAVFTIPVEAPAKYQRVLFGGIQKPTQITTFSYDERRTLHHDDRSRRYYHPPPRNADLNYGFERLVERDESIDEHLDSLLNSLMVLGQRNDDLDQSRRQAHVITWRGMMTRFCTLLYESRDSFEMNAMLIGETLYVEEHSSKAQNADKRWRNDERQRRLGYHGYSLESYCCHTWRTGHPGVDAWDGDVNTNVQWCSVVKTKLGSLRMVLGGEVDAVHSDDLTPVEVKASMQIRNGRDEERFEVKMLRFYMQSFLLGIQRIVVGFRDQRGFLVTHQEMETLAMPRAVRGKPHAWDPMACLTAASEILTSVRDFISKAASPSLDRLPPPEEAEKSTSIPVFRIAFDPHTSNRGTGQADTPGKQLSVFRLMPDEVLQNIKGGTDKGRVGFLTTEYYEFARQRLRSHP